MDKLLTNLESSGFHVYPDFLTDETCDRLRAVLSRLPDQDLVNSSGDNFHGSCTILAPNILTHDSGFIDLALEPRFIDVADRYFGPGAFQQESNPYHLNLIHARAVSQDAPDQELHIDSRLCGVYPPLGLHIFIYLDDCLEEDSGATLVVPASHKLQRYPSDSDKSFAIPLNVCKGAVVFLNSNLFHGSSAKKTPGTRWIITIAYTRWWIRQQFAIPYFTGWPRTLSEREKWLFGFYNYAEKNNTSRGLKSRGSTPILVPRA